MRWKINSKVKINSFEYFEKTLITDNGFREYDVRWLLGKEINSNGFLVLGCAYGTMMKEVLKEDTVVVGNDFRVYSQDLCRSFIVGLLSTGVNVIDLGLTLTPMVYFAQHHFNCKAGAQVTASHNENGWTGLKLGQGLSSTLDPDGVKKFKEIVKSGKFAVGKGSYEILDGLFNLYKKDVVNGFTLKKPLKVVIAAGNGTAGRYAPDVFRQIGCEVVELDCTADWDFKRHNPNPEDISFLNSIKESILNNNADIGIGIDGDGDRIGVLDNEGKTIYSDKLGLILARWICKSHPNRSIVIDVKSSGLFSADAVLQRTGTKVVMWKTGHSYIKTKVAETNAIAGFEKSGHWFLNKPYGRGYDDAVLSSIQLLKMLDESKESLSQLVDNLPENWQSPTLSAYCADNIKYSVVGQITAQYLNDEKNSNLIAGKKIKDIVTINGVRFTLEDNSWGLVRASSTKPALVIVGESQTSEDILYDIIEHIQTRLAKDENVGDYDQQMPARNS